MYWNQLPYSLQKRVISSIRNTIGKEKDRQLQDAIVSAIYELEIWSNSHAIIEQEPDEVDIDLSELFAETPGT